jgi:RHS repeat-associated protein
MTAPNGAVWKYRYDATARRIEKHSPTGESWRYVWRGQDMADVLHEGALVESYVHEPGGTCPLLRQDETGAHYILPDQNDGPSEEVSAAGGALGWQARKGTWAEGWKHHGHAGGEPFLGQWFDAESGLHYNRFRYYDPELGRYLSPDPAGLLGGLNGLITVSDPVGYSDRYGLAADGPGCGISQEDEEYFRAMSQADYEHLVATGRLRATGETFISPSQEYAQRYDGVLVRFTLASGTTEQLEALGVRDNSRAMAGKYPDMPPVRSGWPETGAQFKQDGDQGTIGLGKGPALDAFNENMTGYEPIPR